DSETFCSISHETLEAGTYVWLGDMDVVFFGDSRRTVAHQFGERVPIHPALGSSGAECAQPAVEREPFQSGVLDCSATGFLNVHLLHWIRGRKYPCSSLPVRGSVRDSVGHFVITLLLARTGPKNMD
ncbi:MAG: hypothetical protein JWN63_961, partial [Candidatus Acidoferrum typicum]|nr:hypothetical protein [Candidatus Acidoferrum typicum]